MPLWGLVLIGIAVVTVLCAWGWALFVVLQ
jgi:hypothetical protein